MKSSQIQKIVKLREEKSGEHFQSKCWKVSQIPNWYIFLFVKNVALNISYDNMTL